LPEWQPHEHPDLEAGDPVPEPERQETLPIGKWAQRVPRSLHQKLATMANNEGVSLNQFVTSMLSQQISIRAMERSLEQLLANHKRVEPTAKEARITTPPGLSGRRNGSVVAERTPLAGKLARGAILAIRHRVIQE
jgi:hypothetical protein